jgi:hypothetical protein
VSAIVVCFSGCSDQLPWYRTDLYVVKRLRLSNYSFSLVLLTLLSTRTLEVFHISFPYISFQHLCCSLSKCFVFPVLTAVTLACLHHFKRLPSSTSLLSLFLQYSDRENRRPSIIFITRVDSLVDTTVVIISNADTILCSTVVQF